MKLDNTAALIKVAADVSFRGQSIDVGRWPLHRKTQHRKGAWEE